MLRRAARAAAVDDVRRSFPILSANRRLRSVILLFPALGWSLTDREGGKEARFSVP